MAFLQQATQALMQPLAQVWQTFVLVLPGLLAAFVILLIGYFVGLFFSYATQAALRASGFLEWLVKKTNTKYLFGKFDMEYFFGTIIKWYVFILFLSPAAQITKLIPLSKFFYAVALWVPNFIAAVIIALIGFIVANYVDNAVKKTKAIGSKVIAEILRIVILIFAFVIALAQIGLNITLAQNTFLIVVSGAVFAVSLALGLGFGLGLKDEAKATIKKFKKKL